MAEPGANTNFNFDVATNEVYFTNTSTDQTTANWDFGDGSPIDNTINPTHTFVPGVYNVCLSNTSCLTNCQTVTIAGGRIKPGTMANNNLYIGHLHGAFATIRRRKCSLFKVEIR